VKRGLWFEVHWLLSIALGVIIAIIGVTGAALSFRGEITEFLNRDIMRVDSQGKEPMAINELLEAASASLSNARINSLALYNDPDKTIRLSVSEANSTNTRGRAQYIDPYSARIIPYDSMKGSEFFSLMVSWHRWLGDPQRTVGKHAVAIATIALIVVTITGLYLYLPFMRRNFYASLTIDFSKKGRGFLYKLHSVFGVWTLIFVLLMSFTGLWWSYDWYRSALYWVAGVEPTMQRGGGGGQQQPQPNAGGVQGAVANAEDRAQTRGANADGRGDARGAFGGAPNAQSGTNINAAANAEGRGANANAAQSSGSQGARAQPSGAPQQPPAPRTSEDYLAAAKAYDLFRQIAGDDFKSVTISLPQAGAKVFSLNYIEQNPAHSRASNQLQLNAETSEIVRHTKYDDKSFGEKFISSIFPLHSGDFFGVVGLILYCVSSLAMALFAITGYMLYYERFVRERKRKKKKNAQDNDNAQSAQIAVEPVGALRGDALPEA
jgi:sulfite reductase (NADPH) flavoprotein alpha-component